MKEVEVKTSRLLISRILFWSGFLYFSQYLTVLVWVLGRCPIRLIRPQKGIPPFPIPDYAYHPIGDKRVRSTGPELKPYHFASSRSGLDVWAQNLVHEFIYLDWMSILTATVSLILCAALAVSQPDPRLGVRSMNLGVQCRFDPVKAEGQPTFDCLARDHIRVDFSGSFPGDGSQRLQ